MKGSSDPGKITVAQAIAHGQRTITVPVLIVQYGTAAALALAVLTAALRLNWPGPVAGLMFIGCFLVGMSLAWTLWSFLTPRWRLWAYRRVDDLEGLRTEAVRRKLIWPAGHRFEKTEIRSRRLTEALSAFENPVTK